MGKTDKTTTTEQEVQIDPQLEGYSRDIAEALMGYGSYNPWDLEYTGQRIAEPNQAQIDVMDATADAGNAFGFDFTSAAEGLPTDWDALALAKSGISPELQELYDQLYGDGGIMSQYRLDGTYSRDDETTSQKDEWDVWLEAFEGTPEYGIAKKWAEWGRKFGWTPKEEGRIDGVFG